MSQPGMHLLLASILMHMKMFWLGLCDKGNPSSGPVQRGRTAGGAPVTPEAPCAPSLLSTRPRPTTTCIASIFRSLFVPPACPPPLQYGCTPLRAAAIGGSAPVVALLLATPGVDPLAKDEVRGAQRWLVARLPHSSLLLQAGHTPLDWAQSGGQAATAALLRADPRVAAALAAAGKG